MFSAYFAGFLGVISYVMLKLLTLLVWEVGLIPSKVYIYTRVLRVERVKVPELSLLLFKWAGGCGL